MTDEEKLIKTKRYLDYVRLQSDKLYKLRLKRYQITNGSCYSVDVSAVRVSGGRHLGSYQERTAEVMEDIDNLINRYSKVINQERERMAKLKYGELLQARYLNNEKLCDIADKLGITSPQSKYRFKKALLDYYKEYLLKAQ